MDKILAGCVMIFVLFWIVVLINTLVVYYTWNFLAPDFGLPTLNFIQCFALSVLSSSLFKSININQTNDS